MTIEVKYIKSTARIPVFITGRQAAIAVLRDLFGEAEHLDEVVGLPRGAGDPDTFGYPHEETDHE